MSRVLSVYMPGWSIDLTRRRLRAGKSKGSRAGPDLPEPVLLVATSANRQLVADCCAEARGRGVRPGMTLAHARALLEAGCAPIVQAHNPQRDEAALRALAVWANRFAPIVAVDPPGGLLLDVSGCERLSGGEDQLIQRLLGALERLGFPARAAIGPSVGCAWAMARFGSSSRPIVHAGEERDTLAPLPIEALRLEAETIAALHEVAIDRVGHLLDVQRGDLAQRFGPSLLRRLDQAMSLLPEAIEPVRPRTPLSVERTCDGPTRDLEAILRACRQLVGELCAALKRRESGLLRLEVVFDRVDAPAVRHAIVVSYPSRDEGHLWKLLRPKVESTNMGFGIERVVLTAVATRGLAHEQAVRWGSEGPEERGRREALGTFLDTLGARFEGWQAALRAELVESHVPERAFCFRGMGTLPILPRNGESPHFPRPPLLYAEPQPVEVMALAPEGPPAWLRWQGQHGNGRAVAVRASLGPERIAWEWWRDERPGSRFHGERDYYAVQDEHGRWLWVYRHLETNRWFVHGEWA